MKTIRVGGVPEHFNLPWHLAIEAGKFSQQSIDLKYQDFPGGTGSLMQALEKDEVDIAVALTQGAVAKIINGNPSRLVKVYVESPLIWGIHVPAGSDIEAVDQIRGRTIAVSRFGSGSHLMSIVDASERGWETNNQKFEVVKNLKGAREALRTGKADVFLWERFTTQPYVDCGEFRRVGIRETAWPAFVVVVREPLIKNHRDIVTRLLGTINNQCQQLMDDPQATSTISKRYELSLPETKEWFSKTTWNVDFERPTSSIVTVLGYLNRLGIVDAPQATPDDVWCQLENA
jgi:ABC-type nitrate/sulfonate/bicarbonate transport system substrate-binding protein